MEGERNCGPYKATKLWNEMVETFRNGIPLKRHRRHIKVYDNCFTGHEAVNWFQTVLQRNLNLGNIVTREQTIQLLNKFLKAGIFQTVGSTMPLAVHYQYLKEGDLYQLSDISSPRLPLANKSQNVPHKARVNQWSFKNADVVTKKVITTAHSHPEITVPRLDAHHTVGLPVTKSSVLQPIEDSWNCHTSTEKCNSALSLADQGTRSKSDIFTQHIISQNMQNKTKYVKSNFNQVCEGYRSGQTDPTVIKNGPNVTRHSRGHSSLPMGSSGHILKMEPPNSYEIQHRGTSENYNRERKYIKSEKTSAPNFSDNTESCKWLEPLTLDSIDAYDLEKRNCVPQTSIPSSTTSGYRHLETYTTLPRSRTLQGSTTALQTQHNHNKPYVNNTKQDSAYSIHNAKLSQRNIHVTGNTKSLHSDNVASRRHSYFNINNDIDGATTRQDVNIDIFHGGKNLVQGGSGEGKPVHHYRSTSASQLKCNENNMKEDRDPLRRSGSMGFSRKTVDKHVPATVLEVGDIWKKVVMDRFEKLTPGLETTFRFEFQNIPGEWLAANASRDIHLHHDSQFPQSLVAAMNCLVHWPQAVPNEIIMAFKEHYFKLQEPLTTFKLYNILTEVFLYVATGNLAMDRGTMSKRQELSASSVLTMVLPPNSCFETAFTSDSPVTRIVPQRSVDTLHFSRRGRPSRNAVPKRIASAPNLCEQLPNVHMTQRPSGRLGTKRQVTGGKRAMKLAGWKTGRRVKIGVEDDAKLCHFRNKSGGYVNPALSQSIEDVIKTEDVADTAKIQLQYGLELDQELDYIAALESLNTLMRCSRRDKPSIPVNGQGIDVESDIEQNGSRSSESSSYYTAVSSSSSENSSRRSSGVLADSFENIDTAGVTMHLNIGDTGENIMVTVMQLIFMCIPVYNRTQLRYLLQFMNQWNLHHSLCGQTDVVGIFTPTILRSECEANFDAALARSIVYFLVSHHELILSIPSDLEAEVEHLAKQQTNHVNRKDVKPHDNVTYCQQVSSRQFEQQRLTGSQLALSELLEQILSDCKMGSKEKRRRLKMFQESYPHIYHRRFPESVVQDKTVKKQNRGLLNLATLTRLKSLRV